MQLSANVLVRRLLVLVLEPNEIDKQALLCLRTVGVMFGDCCVEPQGHTFTSHLTPKMVGSWCFVQVNSNNETILVAN